MILSPTPKVRHDWHTFDECEFIRRLGTHGERRATNTERRALLKQYLRSIPNRAEWGRINSEQVKIIAEIELKSLQKELA